MFLGVEIGLFYTLGLFHCLTFFGRPDVICQSCLFVVADDTAAHFIFLQDNYPGRGLPCP